MQLKKRTLISMLILTLLIVIPLSSVAARAVYPETIPLENGYQPEGIALGYGHTFYTGSLNGGAIFRGDLRSGQVEMISAPGPRMAVGMSFDPRSGLLFVAGGVTGAAYVFDGVTGEMVASYQLTDAPATFINDVIITRTAAYITDSFQKQIYQITLGPGGAFPEPTEVDKVKTIPLGDGFDFTPGAFNANGIEASPDGGTLIVVNSGAGKLYLVDPSTGDADPIELGGGAVDSGDGLVLQGHTLYVVQNFANKIAVVELDPGFASGAIAGCLFDADFRIPTTAAAFGDALYAVNARFDQIPPGGATEDDTFEAVRVSLKGTESCD